MCKTVSSEHRILWGSWVRTIIRTGKPVAYDELNGHIVPPCGSVGFRWGESGHWNIEQKTADGQQVQLRLSLIDTKDGVASVGFPYFGGSKHPHFTHSTMM